MALFNGSSTTSISGWFSSVFQAKADKDENEELSEDNHDFSNNECMQPNNEARGEEHKEADKETEYDGESIPNQSKQLLQNANGTQEMMIQANLFGSYLHAVASEVGKNVSRKVSEGAVTLKRKVETILDDLNREQQEFIDRKQEKLGGGDHPPWFGCYDEETMKQKIVALSLDTRNFLRDPPVGVQFQFDFEQMSPVAMATLKQDDNLKMMRFRLVPTKITEDAFWRNYFYRVSLIKQSAQLSTLSDMREVISRNAGSSESSCSSIVIVESQSAVTSRSPKPLSTSNCESENLQHHAPESPDVIKASDELPPVEFVSDAFDSSSLNPDDLEREMKELGMEEGCDDGIPQWEREFQEELEEYEMAHESDTDEIWEKEIEKMLNTSDASS